jgi:hypothetical protein
MDQPGLEGLTLGCQVVEQAREIDQITLAGGIGQGRLLFTKKAEPGKPVGIAAQLRELAQLREMRLEERQEATSGGSIAVDRTGPQCSCEGLDMRFKNLTEGGIG